MPKFSGRPYPPPAIDRSEPDLTEITVAFEVLTAECTRIQAGSATAADRDHADFIRAKLDQVRAMVRGRILAEREELQRRMFT